MNWIESVVVGERKVGVCVQKELNQWFRLFGDGVVQWRVAFYVLQTWMGAKIKQDFDYIQM